MSTSCDYGVYINQFRFQDIWNGWLIRLSLEHQYLMDALLALSCFHLRSLNPSDRQLPYISHKYMARAISEQHEQISRGIDQSNAQAAFATSNLIAWHSRSILFKSCPPSDITAYSSQTYLIQGTGPPLHWFRPYQGVRQILALGWDWIKNSDIQPILEQGVGFAHIVRDLTADPIQEMPFGFLLKDLDRDNTDAETLACYDLSINHLNWIYHQATPRHILRFPAMTDTRFLELLSQNDPRILTIVGYFFMLIKRLDGLWWLEGSVENEFLNVMKLLPTSWQDKMDWAIRDFEASEKKSEDGTQSLGSGSGTDAFLFARKNSAAETLSAANSSDWF
ncbi:hypothetical protein B0O99DRAFT_502302 [Bisporella sp. PMI_857]|nr:hypothetical protein B0O99DRAFT_502302 [Bisporella sp. PMI_857]